MGLFRELMLAMRLGKAAEQGRPLILAIRPNKTVDLVWPESIRGNIVRYRDPATGRYEVVLLKPESVLHMGKVIIIPHVQGFLENVGWREMASLLWAQPDTVERLRRRLLEVLELRKDLLPESLYREYKERLANAGAIDVADIWRELRAAGLINNIPPPEPPAELVAPEQIAAIAEKLRLAYLSEAMGYIKTVTGLQSFFKPGLNWKTIIGIIALVIIMFFLFSVLGGIFSPPPATHTPPVHKV